MTSPIPPKPPAPVKKGGQTRREGGVTATPEEVKKRRDMYTELRKEQRDPVTIDVTPGKRKPVPTPVKPGRDKPKPVPTPVKPGKGKPTPVRPGKPLPVAPGKPVLYSGSGMKRGGTVKGKK